MNYFYYECKHHGYTKFIIITSGNRRRCVKCRSLSVQKRRIKVKQLALDYKGNKCTYCGYTKCTHALVFHHVDPKQKDFGIASKGLTRSWNKVKKELDKCILLCANCHFELHEKEKRELKNVIK